MTASSKWRAALAATAASAALAVVPLLGAQPALAGPYPPPGGPAYPPQGPSLRVNPTSVEPGDRVWFRGTGFQAEQDVVAALASRIVILGHYEADENGVVTGRVTIPENTRPGEHHFLLRAEDPDRTLGTEIEVLGDGNGEGPGGPGRPTDGPGWPTGGPGEPTDPPAEPSDPPADPTEPPADPTEDPGWDNGSGGSDGWQGKPGHHHGKPHLADTGDDHSAALLGGVAGLLLLGGGALVLTRRVKRG